MVEQAAVNGKVVGSSPTPGAIFLIFLPIFPSMVLINQKSRQGLTKGKTPVIFK